MNIQLHAPKKTGDKLQKIVNDCIENLKNYFSRIRTVEIFMTEEADKKVEIKLYLSYRVLYATDHADGFEEAFRSASDKMRNMLIKYQKEVAIF